MLDLCIIRDSKGNAIFVLTQNNRFIAPQVIESIIEAINRLAHKDLVFIQCLLEKQMYEERKSGKTNVDPILYSLYRTVIDKISEKEELLLEDSPSRCPLPPNINVYLLVLVFVASIGIVFAKFFYF